MRDLFMCLLLNLANHGKLTEANMYTGGTFSQIKLKTENGTYSISISKEETDDGNKNN